VASLPLLDPLPRPIWQRLRIGKSPDRVEAAQFSDLLTALTDTSSGPHTHYRQSVLRLLARIKAHQRPGRPHTVFVASPVTEAGNSATALALAYAAALAGERVLLIDATSNRPDLSNIFAASLEQKNVVVLDNKEHLAEITARDSRSGLAFLPLAFVDLRTLKSQQRRRLVAGLNGLIQSYDLVFIDAGGLLEDESAMCLLPTADEVFLVARHAATTREEIAESMEVLEPAGDRLTGGILAMTH
jgi:receptor protein-tyrosine kinase